VRISGATNDKPTPAVAGGSLILAVKGMDNSIYYKMMDLVSGAWTGWIQIPGAISSAPTLEPVTSPSSYVNLVVRGTDNGIYYNRYTSSWTGWVPLGGATIDRPDLYAYIPAGTLFLFVRGTGNGVYYKTMGLSTYTWTTSWTQIPGAISSGPTMDAGVVVVRGMDNGIYLWSD